MPTNTPGSISSVQIQVVPEFQVVLIIDYDDGRMYPLTEDCPKCLLPISNRKLLSYQLDMLNKSGALEIYIVAPKEFELPLSNFVKDYRSTVGINVNIDLVFVEDMMGSADGLRAVSERIRGDFICVSSDFISQFSLGDLAHMHRVNTSDLTMLFAVPSGKDLKKDEVDQEYVAITGNGRVLMKTPTLEVDEALSISKALIHRTDSLFLRNDLQDMGIYIMSYWVIEYVSANKRMSSIRADLVPYLVQRQFQSENLLLKSIPALEHRRRPLASIESWLVASSTPTHHPEMVDGIAIAKSKGPAVTTSLSTRSPMERQVELSDYLYQAIYTAPTSPTHSQSHEDSPAKRDRFLPFGTSGEDSRDLLRCFGMVYDLPAASNSSGVLILNRITSIPSYLAINKDLPMHHHSPKTPWRRLTNYLKKEASIVGDGCDLTAKNVTIKQCSIGNNCKIGQMSKLNNCVIMENVTIGENCTIQNCVVGERVVIEGNCNLNECHIGSGFKVQAGSKVKNETFSING